MPYLFFKKLLCENIKREDRVSRIVYINGKFVNEAEAKISVFDRGFLFADAVYEVSSVVQGKLVDNTRHLLRLKRSLSELNMSSPKSTEQIKQIQTALIQKNRLQEGIVYLQITRGSADRDFVYDNTIKPSIVMFTQSMSIINNPKAQKGISIITTADIRWGRRDIKTTALLASSMAKTYAKSMGADDAWMIEEGFITEGSSSNAYIIKQDGTLITRQLGTEILAGVTRKAILSLAKKEAITIEERPFSLDEALNAAEVFSSSASTFIMPVISINGHTIGNGQPGELTRKIRQSYIQTALKSLQ